MATKSGRVAPILLVILLCTALHFAVQLQPFLSSSIPAEFSSDGHAYYNSTNNKGLEHWKRKEHDKRQTQIARSKEIIPDWMASYLGWHQQQRERLRQHLLRDNNTNIGDIKYLVVRCVETEVCGGLSDRLQPMPFYLMVANLTERVLLVHWRKPCELEHFLTPPLNGLDWRVSGTAVSISEIRNEGTFYDGHGNGLSKGVRMLYGAIPGGDHFVEAKVLNIRMDGGQRTHNARVLFNKWRAMPNQRPLLNTAYLGWNGTIVNDHDLFEDAYRLLFQPSPGVERAIYNTMARLDILGQEYNAAQVRAKHPKGFPDELVGELFRQFYKNESETMTPHRILDARHKMDFLGDFEITDKMIPFFVKTHSNAIACADQLAPGLPIYLASDSNFGTYMQNVSQYPIRVGAQIGSEGAGVPLHIDCDCNQGRDPADFYLLFVDIYIMSRAKCLSYSGGLGAFPIRMSDSNSCYMDARNTVCDPDNSTAEDTII